MEQDLTSYEGRELNWQLCTKAGNLKMEERLYAEAQTWYKQAIELAQLMLEEAMQGSTHPDAIHPYVVSCHNRADVYLQLGNIQEAETVFQQTYDRVVEIVENSSLSDALRLESFQALKMIAFEMNRFYCELDRADLAQEIMSKTAQKLQLYRGQIKFVAAPDSEKIGDNSVQLHTNFSEWKPNQYQF